MSCFSMGTVYLLRLLHLFTGISVLQQTRSWKIVLPSTVTAVEGTCVVVRCQTEPYSRVTWYQYHDIYYPVVYDGVYPSTVEHQFRGRTKLLGEPAEGNCTLRIDDMRPTDNNIKVYVWVNPGTKTNQKFYQQTVTILVERKAPSITILKQIVAGEIFQVKCSIKYSCPFSPPSLHWSIRPALENSTSIAFIEEEQGQWLYTATMEGLGTYKMHNTTIRCSAQFKIFTAESQQITLSVLYKPVTVTLILKEELVTEGGSIIMECAANCNPQAHMYSWLRRQMGHIKKINSTQNNMSFSNITRNTSLSCIAHNAIGVGQSKWLDLDVQYAPVILPEPSCYVAGEILRCICQAEASPNASISWTIDGNNTLPSSFESRYINKKNVVSGEIGGPAKSQTNVSCTAWNSRGRDTKYLSIRNLSKTSHLPMWLSASAFMLLGIGLLFGCAIFICRKHSTNRPQSSLNNVQQEQRYSSLQRSQYEDRQLSPHRLENNPDNDGLSCIYDNDFVENPQRPTRAHECKNNATALQMEGNNQLLAQVQ
uniref:Myelin-associated glycoprotein-like n=1 Tax=Mastacembelus armatus TaxID=205130 RepID=A0A3Q3LT06_9TELE